jgi:O-antigen/teichoic acid export membrane protein
MTHLSFNKSIYIILGQLMLPLSNFLLATILSRTIPENELGVYFLLNSILALFITFTQFGGIPILQKTLMQNDEQAKIPDYINSTVVISFFLLPISIGIFFFTGVKYIIFLVWAPAVLISTLNLIMTHDQMIGSGKVFFIVNFFLSFCISIVVALSSLYYQSGYLRILVLAFCSVGFLGVYFCLGKFSWRTGLNQFNKNFGMAKFIFLNTFILTANASIDRYLIAGFIDLGTLAKYGLTAQIGSLLVLTGVLVSKVSSMYIFKKINPHEESTFARNIIGLASLPLCINIIVSYIIVDWQVLNYLYTTDYFFNYKMVMLILISYSIYSSIPIVNNAAHSLGLSQALMKSSLVAVLSNFLISFSLVHYLGVWGVLFGTLFANILILIIPVMKVRSAIKSN